MTYEQQALLYLVRLGIGNNTESGVDFTGVDWRKLVDSSFAQAVPAIAVDGEKLYEEVLNCAEKTRPTVHPKILVASVREYPYDLALKNEQALYELSFSYDAGAIVKKMAEIVPEYKSTNPHYQSL